MVKGFHPLTIYAYTIKMRKWKNDGKMMEKLRKKSRIGGKSHFQGKSLINGKSVAKNDEKKS